MEKADILDLTVEFLKNNKQGNQIFLNDISSNAEASCGLTATLWQKPFFYIHWMDQMILESSSGHVQSFLVFLQIFTRAKHSVQLMD